MGRIHKNDVGTLLFIYTGINLSEAITCAIKVRKPDGSIVVWDASVYGDPTDGMVGYVIQEGDVNQSGTYCANVYVETPSGKWTGESFRFFVAGDCD